VFFFVLERNPIDCLRYKRFINWSYNIISL